MFIFLFSLLFFLTKSIMCSSIFLYCKRDFAVDSNAQVPNWAPVLIYNEDNITTREFKNKDRYTLYKDESSGNINDWDYSVEKHENEITIKLQQFDNQKRIFIYKITNHSIEPIYSEFDYMGYTFFAIFVSLIISIFIFLIYKILPRLRKST